MGDNTSLKLTSDSEIGYSQLLAVLVRRSGWLLAVFSGVLIVTAILTWLEKPKYQSSMQLLVEPNYEQRLQEDGTNPIRSSASEQDYATQLRLMQSWQFVEKALALLQAEHPELNIEGEQVSLSLSQLEKTKIFQADYISDDPAKAQWFLEALQRVYLDYNLAHREQRLKRGLAATNEQLQVLRQNLSESQTALKQFRQQQNLIDPGQQAEAIVKVLNENIQEQLALQAQYQQEATQYATWQQQLALSPEEALILSNLSQSSRYQALLNQLQQTELALAERRATFTDQDPKIQILLQQRQNQIELMRQEIERIFGQVPYPLNTAGESLLFTKQLSQDDLRLVSALTEAQAKLRGLQARLQTLKTTEQQLRSDLNRFPGLMAEYDRLKPAVDIERAVLERLLNQQQQIGAELARGGFNWQVVEPPTLGRKISPNPKRNMLLGVVLGLFLGSMAAFLRESIDDVIREPGTLQHTIKVPLLGSLPAYQRKSSTLALPFLQQPRSRLNFPLIQIVQQPTFRESFDLIYQNIRLLSKTRRINSLMVTSAQRGEGKTTLALGLAISAARLHQKVLLIDADFRHPSLHSGLGLSEEQGLSSLLIHQQSNFDPSSFEIANVRIDVLPAGSVVPDPVRLLSSSYMREMISFFESIYDLVIFDTSSALGTVDAIQVASICDGVILIGRLNHVTQSALQDAYTMLNPLRLLGVVANESHTYIPDHLISLPEQPQFVLPSAFEPLIPEPLAKRSTNGNF